MPLTYEAISTVTVGAGGVSSISFTSIPQTFTDLRLALSARSATSNWADNPLVSINTSTSTFSRRSMYAEGGAAGSEVGSTGRLIGLVPAATSTASTFGVFDIYIPNYTNASNFKSFSVDSVGENNSSTSGLWVLSGLWSTAAAVTQISLTLNSTANFVQYSTATLYGIKNS